MISVESFWNSHFSCRKFVKFVNSEKFYESGVLGTTLSRARAMYLELGRVWMARESARAALGWQRQVMFWLERRESLEARVEAEEEQVLQALNAAESCSAACSRVLCYLSRAFGGGLWASGGGAGGGGDERRSRGGGVGDGGGGGPGGGGSGRRGGLRAGGQWPRRLLERAFSRNVRCA